MKNKMICFIFAIAIIISTPSFALDTETEISQCVEQIMIAGYDAEGRMIDIHHGTLDGEYYNGISNGLLNFDNIKGEKIVLFYLKEDGTPICEKINLHGATNVIVVRDGANYGGSLKKLLIFSMYGLDSAKKNAIVAITATNNEELSFGREEEMAITDVANQTNTSIYSIAIGDTPPLKFMVKCASKTTGGVVRASL